MNPKPSSGSTGLKQGETEQEDKEEPLAFDDLQSDSDTTVGGCSPVDLTLQELGSPRETAVEVHAWNSEVEAL